MNKIIENYFVSQDFLNVLKQIKEYDSTNRLIDYIGNLVDIGIKYSLLFDNEFSKEDLTNFLHDYLNEVLISKELLTADTYTQRSIISEFVKTEFMKKYSITDDDFKDLEVKKKIYIMLFNRLVLNAYKYHAFNSSVLDKILEEGLNPNATFVTTLQREIIRTCAKYGVNNILGWKEANCDGKISYSMDSSVSYSYGVDSPEWFSQFTGGATYFDRSKCDSHSYALNDYNGAKNNLLELMKERNFTMEDAKKVMTFFEENWALYENGYPVLMAIPDETDDYVSEWDLENFITNKIHYNPTDAFDFCLFYYDGWLDEHTREIIDTSDATIIKMPKLSDAVKTINNKHII